MCEPVTIGLIVGGAALDAYAKSQAAKGEAAAAEANAQIEKRAAVDSEARGEQVAAGAREEGAQAVASERAVAGASGLESSGFYENLFATTARDAEHEAQVARAEGAREAWGHRVSAANLEAQAAAAKKAGKIGILTSFVGGANSVAAYRARVK